MTAPFRLTPTPQPGESGRFHVAKSGSTLAAGDAVGDDPQAAARTIAIAKKRTDEASSKLLSCRSLSSFCSPVRIRLGPRATLAFSSRSRDVICTATASPLVPLVGLPSVGARPERLAKRRQRQGRHALFDVWPRLIARPSRISRSPGPFTPAGSIPPSEALRCNARRSWFMVRWYVTSPDTQVIAFGRRHRRRTVEVRSEARFATSSALQSRRRRQPSGRRERWGEANPVRDAGRRSLLARRAHRQARSGIRHGGHGRPARRGQSATCAKLLYGATLGARDCRRPCHPRVLSR